MHNNSISVSVITLNYNQNDYTLDCINSLLQSSFEGFNVLLIDNGSSDANYRDLENRVPEDSRLSLIRIKENLGYVGGVNHGLSLASSSGSDYFLIMNNDTLIDINAISALVTCAEKHQGNAIVSGKVYNYDDQDTLQYVGSVSTGSELFDYKTLVPNQRTLDTGQFESEQEMAMLDDIFWLIPNKIYKSVGSYSSYFYLYGEQTDYAICAKRKNFKLIYTPKAKLWHKGGITTTGGDKSSPKLMYWLTSATLKLNELHNSKDKASKFRNTWIMKRRIKIIIDLLLGKLSWKHYRAFNSAVQHTKVWMEVKYVDNGYNPF